MKAPPGKLFTGEAMGDTEREDLEPGRSLGVYRIESILGSGSFGTVYRAVHAELGRAVALKVIRRRYREDAQVLARFEKEMRTMMRYPHPGLAKLLDAGEADGSPFIAAELVVGSDLAERVKSQGPLPTGNVIRLGLELARILEYLHGHDVLHRDVKPSNVIHRDGAPPILLDLGLCKALGEESLTQPGHLVGTPLYLAPEVFRSASHDRRSEVYSLSGLLFFAFTGTPPLLGDEIKMWVTQGHYSKARWPTLLAPGRESGLSDLLEEGLEFDPSRRCRDMSHFLRGLEDCLPRRSRGSRSDVAAGASAAPAGSGGRGASGGPTGDPRARGRDRRRAVSLAVSTLGIAAVISFMARRGPPPVSPTRSSAPVMEVTPTPAPARPLEVELWEAIVAEQQWTLTLDPVGSRHADLVAIPAVESVTSLVLRPGSGWPATYRVGVDGHWMDASGREARLDPKWMKRGLQHLEVEAPGVSGRLQAQLILERSATTARPPDPGWPARQFDPPERVQRLEAAWASFMTKGITEEVLALAEEYPDSAMVQDRAARARLGAALGVQAFTSEPRDPVVDAPGGVACFQASLALDPRFSDTWLNPAFHMRDFGQMLVARNLMIAALVLDPAYARAWLELGSFHRELLLGPRPPGGARRIELARQGARASAQGRRLRGEVAVPVLMDELELWMLAGDRGEARRLVAAHRPLLMSTPRGREIVERMDPSPPR